MRDNLRVKLKCDCPVENTRAKNIGIEHFSRRDAPKYQLKKTRLNLNTYRIYGFKV